MFRILYWGCFLLVTIISMSCSKQSFEVMSYNIRLDHEGDKENNWHHRKADMIKYIEKHQPDFLGVQEALPQQMDYLDAQLTDYKYVGVGRDDGKRAGEFSAIFYRTTSWRPIVDSTFWLSETPEQPSLGWDANIKRVCTYGIFEDAKGNQVAVHNVHFDHQGQAARAGSVNLLKSHISDIARSYPVVLMGDFNFAPNDPLYTNLMSFISDSHHLSNKKEIPVEGTFNGFAMEGDFSKRIDYVLLTKDKLSVDAYAIETPLTQKGLQLSDHFPVLVTLSIKP